RGGAGSGRRAAGDSFGSAGALCATRGGDDGFAGFGLLQVPSEERGALAVREVRPKLLRPVRNVPGGGRGEWEVLPDLRGRVRGAGGGIGNCGGKKLLRRVAGGFQLSI